MADKLIPKNHGFGTRRVPLETRYYEVYNQPNVVLVDINETPIERITPTGIKTSDAEYAVRHHHLCDGFRCHHRKLRPHRHPRRGRAAAEGQMGGWAADLSRRSGDGFPNMMMLMGPHTALGNIPRSIEYNVDWVTGLLRHAREHGLTRVEATDAGVAAGPITSNRVGWACCPMRSTLG